MNTAAGPARSSGSRRRATVTAPLAPTVGAAAAARGVVRDLLRGAGHTDLVEVACLLTSELVANAVTHSGAPVELVVDLDELRLVVEVVDGTGDLPEPCDARPHDEHGRGLAMVSSLADEWGVEPTPEGKSVWFSIRVR